MKSPALHTLAVLVSVATVGAGAARAEPIAFSYSWGISPGAVFTGSSDGTLSGASTGSVAFALAPDGSASATLGGAATQIPGASLTSTSSAGGAAGPDHFDTTYSLTLTLKDTASGDTGTATFAGTLAGDLTATSTSVKATFVSPVTQALTLGGQAYSVTISPALLSLPAPGALDPAQINALVTVGSSDPIPHHVPEPSSLALTSCALSALGLAYRRRARVNSPATVA